MSDWTVSEMLGAAQTAVLLITALIVLWYTRETARIRKATDTQNTLLAEQLRLLASAREFELF